MNWGTTENGVDEEKASGGDSVISHDLACILIGPGSE